MERGWSRLFWCKVQFVFYQEKRHTILFVIGPKLSMQLTNADESQVKDSHGTHTAKSFLLQEIGRLQKVQGANALSAKDEMARLSRHLGSLPLLAKHRINCIRTAIKRNMDVQNFAYAKQMLELLLSKAPPGKQDELRSLIDMCVQRGLSNKSIDPLEDPSQFCAATLSRLSTIGYDVCDLCGSKFSALSTPGCIICGMGSIKRSDALAGPVPVPSPFG